MTSYLRHAGAWQDLSATVADIIGGGGVPELDGEVTTAAEIVTIANNEANAGNSYWMRGGDYGELTLTSDARPSVLITFITYPGEQVTFEDVFITSAKNLRFDGNVDNMVREPAGTSITDYFEGDYGLWFQGSGIIGNEIPSVGNCVTLAISNPPDWNENLQFQHFRLGDVQAIADDGDGWRRQHGFVICNGARDILIEDFEIAYLGFDQDPTEGDADGGGFGMQFYSVSGPEAADWGDVTIRRGHFHHTMNDFIQYDPKNDDGIAEVLFEDCLFDVLVNYGLAHADFFQSVGGSTKLTFDSCVFQWGSDFLLHGDNPGATRLFNNCLIGNPNEVTNAHQIVLGKNEDFGAPSYGASDYEWRNCTINMDTDDIQVGSADGDCTNYSQGYRKSETFPWSIS